MNEADHFDLDAADEERELRSQCAAVRLAHAKRMARNSPFIHPDERQEDYLESNNVD